MNKRETSVHCSGGVWPSIAQLPMVFECIEVITF